MLLLITPNIFNKITLKKNYLAQCAGLRLVIIIIITTKIMNVTYKVTKIFLKPLNDQKIHSKTSKITKLPIQSTKIKKKPSNDKNAL